MKSPVKRLLVFGIIALLLVAALVVWRYVGAGVAANHLVLSGTIEADEIQVGSRVGGRIAAVLVSEGQTVKQGQPLIRFESYDLDARLRDAAAAVAQAQANLQKLQNGSRPEEIAEARAQTEAARATLEMLRNGSRNQEVEAARAELDAATADAEVARANFERLRQLTRNGVASRQDYDNAKAALERADGRREAAQQRLSLLREGSRREEIERAEQQYRQALARQQLVTRGARQEDIDAAQAGLERARAALRQIETQTGELEVLAPADAFVEVLQVRPGDLLAPNAPVATLVEVDRLWVRVFVPEPELGHLQLEKTVSVSVDTFANQTFGGRIEQIASRGEFTPRNVQTREERAHQVFAVRVRLDNHAGRLRAGMAADVVISK